MNNLIIVANVIANDDKIELVKAELEKLIVPTRAEKGCIQYDLHQDNENPAHFMFYEGWESRELLEIHLTSEHFKNYVATTEDAVAKFSINEMTVIA